MENENGNQPTFIVSKEALPYTPPKSEPKWFGQPRSSVIMFIFILIVGWGIWVGFVKKWASES